MIPNYDQEIEKRYHPENFLEEIEKFTYKGFIVKKGGKGYYIYAHGHQFPDKEVVTLAEVKEFIK